MPAATASLAPFADSAAASFHAAFVADLVPRTCAERFFADQAARAAAALQQLAADDASPSTLTAQYRLSTLLSRALRELRLLQSDRRHREQDTATTPPAAAAISPNDALPAATPRPPSPARAHAATSPNTSTQPGESEGRAQTPAPARAATPATAPDPKPSPQYPPIDLARQFSDILATASSAAARTLLHQKRRKHRSPLATTPRLPSS